jgi:hypothetical protein
VELVAAGVAIEEFAVEECGLTRADPDDDVIEFSELDGATGEEFIPDVSGVDQPLYDDFIEPPVDPNVASLDGLKAHLDLEYTDAEWRTRLDQFEVEDGTWTVGWSSGLDITEQAPEVCEAVSSYLRDLEPDATILISELDDGTLEYEPIVEKVGAGECGQV